MMNNLNISLDSLNKYTDSSVLKLRIGNQFRDIKDGTIYNVVSITRFHVTGVSSIGEEYAFSYDQIEPVPLTKQLLLSAGFVKSETKNVYNYTIDKEQNWLVSIRYFEEYKCFGLPIRPIRSEYGRGFTTTLESVHQLQNIMFDIADIELRFKVRKKRVKGLSTPGHQEDVAA